MIDEIIIITNHKFYRKFQEWGKGFTCPLPISIIDDGSQTNETRLGAIRDILLVIDKRSLQYAYLMESHRMI